MAINLQNYPPDCGKPVTAQNDNRNIPILIILTVILIGFFLLIFPSRDTALDPIGLFIWLFIILFFLISLAVIIGCYRNPLIGSITLTEKGIRQTVFGGNIFYRWNDIKDVKHEYLRIYSIDDSGREVCMLTFRTPSNPKNQICIEKYNVSITDFMELVEEWRRFHTARMASEPDTNDDLEEYLFAKNPE